MCGIIGFVSQKTCFYHVLVEGLKQLEYRGYDSCGIAMVNQSTMNLIKAKGKVALLEEKCSEADLGTVGIAHTRWATHGEPSEVNAHPHQVQNVTLVHNGIIENSDELRSQYAQKGIEFASATDTEVACAVFDDCLQKTTNKLEAIQLATSILEGSYAFAIIFKDELDKVYAIRKDSPLVLGTKEGMQFLASDISAFLSHTNQIIELRENEVAILSADKITIMQDGKKVEREAHTSQLSVEEIKKDGFDTFMMKEIHEEPQVAKKTIQHYMSNHIQDLMQTLPDMSKYERFVFVGCGSAMYAGMVARTMMEKNARILSAVELASEFRYNKPILNNKTCVVFLSQSGETADTLAALRLCNAEGIDTIGIVNVLGSSIAKEVKYFLPTLAGKEISVATTKAYCAQVAVLSLLCIKVMMQKQLLLESEINRLNEEIMELPKMIKTYIDEAKVESFAHHLSSKQSAFFIGRGIDYALSLEGALKLKEISYIHAEAYAAGELKHGTISLIEQDTPVVGIISDPDLAAKTISNLKEVKARGAKILLMIREDLMQEHIEADEVIILPKVDDFMQTMISIIPLQLLAYCVAKERGCNIDQPRNLAKSVTVE